MGDNIATASKSRESRSSLGNDKSSFLVGSSSDLGISLEKTRQLLESIETNVQSHDEVLPNAEDTNMKHERPHTDDIFREGEKMLVCFL